MISCFDGDEAAYLNWLHANPEGFVVNSDRAENMPQYPMVHVATHRLISSPGIGNFTTGAYVKFCSTNLGALEQWSWARFGRALRRCGTCM